MNKILDYVLLLLSQFAGGPGPKENNLVRFGLPAILWTVLLVVAWLRQRERELPREKLLVWGFGLALARELFMFYHVSTHLIQGPVNEPGSHYAEPLEHALTMAAVVMVAGAFLRYTLDDISLSRRYWQTGLGMAAISFPAAWGWWTQYATANPEIRFHLTWASFAFHFLTSIFAGTAIILLLRKRGWLSSVVSVALSFFLAGGLLQIYNFATGRTYANIVCPICNTLHILAIPLLGYVYIREQDIEKRRAEQGLAAYRDHLEELVEERTAELQTTNVQLHDEIGERMRAEQEIVWRNTELAVQNTIAATLSQSLDLDTVLTAALDTVLAVLEMEAGCLMILEPDGETLTLQTRRGEVMPDEVTASPDQPCSCTGISRLAVAEMEPVIMRVADFRPECRSPFVAEEGLQVLVSTPLIAHGRAVGALSLGTRRPDEIAPDTLQLLTSIGQQVGLAVENANLYQKTEHWANSLTLLHQVSVFLSSTLDSAEIYDQITEQSAKLLGCEVTGVFRWDEDHQEAVAVSSYGLNGARINGWRLQMVESPILSDLITQRRAVAVEDAQTDPRVPELWQERLGGRGFLCVPLWGAENLLAILFMVDPDKPRKWRSDEIELVESFVNRAAVALENAYLHKQLEWAAALEERQRIAAEMHDGLAQTLSYLTIKCYNATELLEAGHAQAVLKEHTDMQVAIERATKEVRQSISSLQESPLPRRSLQAWLSEAVGEFSMGDQPPADLVSAIEEPVFLPAFQLEQVLRVVREALLNAGRHAQAQQIVVRLEQQSDGYSVTIEDDGCGFDLDALSDDGADHFGLSIMRARAARIGGQVSIDSTPMHGTRVSLVWPLVSQAPAASVMASDMLKSSNG